MEGVYLYVTAAEPRFPPARESCLGFGGRLFIRYRSRTKIPACAGMTVAGGLGWGKGFRLHWERQPENGEAV
ncbi:hypothetical protein GCWU000324_00519 [Kingella oralis ATCC 51147]|uniref:Uncharacterized protein n=1 Tax=Kingella oralis ATCC 51147 TaxID=629741 RepID=C4GI28_9NEIS|nr:hypothetical protein GCWU000324_00519 [Kingella oralis ATCC 51147]